MLLSLNVLLPRVTITRFMLLPVTHGIIGRYITLTTILKALIYFYIIKVIMSLIYIYTIKVIMSLIYIYTIKVIMLLLLAHVACDYY